MKKTSLPKWFQCKVNIHVSTKVLFPSVDRKRSNSSPKWAQNWSIIVGGKRVLSLTYTHCRPWWLVSVLVPWHQDQCFKYCIMPLICEKVHWCTIKFWIFLRIGFPEYETPSHIIQIIQTVLISCDVRLTCKTPLYRRLPLFDAITWTCLVSTNSTYSSIYGPKMQLNVSYWN